MATRLLLGLFKGLLVGGLVGLALAKLGFGAPIAIVAYLSAALTGVLVGLVAGKPIWAKDAKIEAGMKALAGALVGAGLLYAARRWLTMEVPEPLARLSAPAGAEPAATTVGQLSTTSLALVAALLGGFFDADNTQGDEGETQAAGALARPGAQRIAVDDEAALDDDEDEAAPPRHAKK
jgi:hypothetical protein